MGLTPQQSSDLNSRVSLDSLEASLCLSLCVLWTVDCTLCFPGNEFIRLPCICLPLSRCQSLVESPVRAGTLLVLFALVLPALSMVAGIDRDQKILVK